MKESGIDWIEQKHYLEQRVLSLEAERDALREAVRLWADETYDEGIAARMRDFLERNP